MRKPSGEVPLAQIEGTVVLVKKDHAHIAAAVRRAQLGADDVHQFNGALSAFSAGDTDQGVLRQIKQDRHIIEGGKIVPDITGFIAQLILCNVELFLRNVDIHLKRDVAGPDPHLEEILLPAVAVPQSGTDAFRQKAFRRRIHLLQGFCVALIFFTDLIGLLDQVIAVGFKAPALFFLMLFLLPGGAGDCQKSSYRSGRDCHHQS